MYEQTQVLPEPESSDDEDLGTPVAALYVLPIRELGAQVFPLHEGENLIARAGNVGDVLINDVYISQRHATIEVRTQGDLRGEVWITDHDSKSKTYLDKRSKKRALKPNQVTPLKDGQVVFFGDVQARFSSQPPLTASAPGTPPLEEPKGLGDSDTEGSEGMLDGAEDTWQAAAAKLQAAATLAEPTQACDVLSDGEGAGAAAAASTPSPRRRARPRRVTICVEESVHASSPAPAAAAADERIAPPLSPTLAYKLDDATQAYGLDDASDDGARTDVSDEIAPDKPVDMEATQAYGLESPRGSPTNKSPPAAAARGRPALVEPTQAYTIHEEELANSDVTVGSPAPSVEHVPSPKAAAHPEATLAYDLDATQAHDLGDATQAYDAGGPDDVEGGEGAAGAAGAAGAGVEPTLAYDAGEATQAYGLEDAGGAAAVVAAVADGAATQAYEVEVEAEGPATGAAAAAASGDGPLAESTVITQDDLEATQMIGIGDDDDPIIPERPTADSTPTTAREAQSTATPSRVYDTSTLVSPSPAKPAPFQAAGNAAAADANDGSDTEIETEPEDNQGDDDDGPEARAARETKVRFRSDDSIIPPSQVERISSTATADCSLPADSADAPSPTLTPDRRPKGKGKAAAQPKAVAAVADEGEGAAGEPEPALEPVAVEAKPAPGPKRVATSGAKRALPSFLAAAASPKKAQKPKRVAAGRARATSKATPAEASHDDGADEAGTGGPLGALTEADAKKMTVVKLKHALTERGLGTSGRKAELLQRLLEALDPLLAPDAGNEAREAATDEDTEPQGEGLLLAEDSLPIRRSGRQGAGRKRHISEVEEGEGAAKEEVADVTAAADAQAAAAGAPAAEVEGTASMATAEDSTPLELDTPVDEVTAAAAEAEAAAALTPPLARRPTKDLRQPKEPGTPAVLGPRKRSRPTRRSRSASSSAADAAAIQATASLDPLPEDSEGEEEASGVAEAAAENEVEEERKEEVAEPAAAPAAPPKQGRKRKRRGAPEPEAEPEPEADEATPAAGPEPEPEPAKTPGRGRGKRRRTAKAQSEESESAEAAAAEPASREASSAESPGTSAGRTKRRSGVEMPRVLFTGIIDKQTEKKIKSLHGTVVHSIDECTHVFCDTKLKRTLKLFVAVCAGKCIVGKKWVDESIAQGQFVDGDVYMMKDASAEKKHSFRLRESLPRARETPVFQGCSFHLVGDLKPPAAELAQIITAGGGTVAKKLPKAGADSVLVVATPDVDPDPLLAAGCSIYAAELVLSAALQQELRPAAHRLFSGGAQSGDKRKAGAQPPGRAKKRGRR